MHTDLLPLSDGRVLLFGNGGMAGEAGLHIAGSLHDINSYTEALNFRSLTEFTLFATQAVEIQPGVVRIIGIALTAPDEVSAFYFDFDTQTSMAGAVNFVPVASGEGVYAEFGTVSPDGALLPVYDTPLFTDFGSIYGSFRLIDLGAATPVDLAFPELVGIVRWQE